ncbi:hypothetical protein SAMN05660297_03634 [Natronincola peptidivorans]|uniref:Uncharacterized protein n=1 Tax=Natronincola peptidivorans TaxID=426128 RepID=A0A1I0HIW2_9FIRM|nr:hypothetical protein [Natronincola peptidivorans]SET83018.1 hypothetical protein SAMN05660297_03634 [Natronincola peptidivorans]
MKKNKRNKILAMLLIGILIVLLTTCGGEESTQVSTQLSSDTEWAIYWYLCGSDLETFYGSATTDLEEILAVKLPENVEIVIQTGGV